MQDTQINIAQKKKQEIPISLWLPAYSKKEKSFVPGVTALNADLFDILNKIGNGEYKPIIDPLHSISDPDQKMSYKKEKLPAVTVSGRFRTPREESSLESHSECLCIDIDSSQNPHITDWRLFRDRQADMMPSTVACFLSASAKGCAQVFKINPDKHKDTFHYIEYELQKEGITIDPAPKNVASLRFVSHDPEIYINENFDSIPVLTPTAEFYEYQKQKEKRLQEVRQNAKPVNSVDDIELFKNAATEAEVHGYVLQRGLGTRLIQFIAGYCNSRGMGCEKCVEYFIAHYGADTYYTKESVSDRIADMYDRYKDQHGTVTISQNIQISFFDVRIDKKKGFVLSLNRVRFIDFLHSQRIGLFFADDKTYIYVQLSGSTFEEITIEQIKKIVQKHINDLPDTFNCGVARLDLLEFIYKGSDTYFGKSFLEFLNRFTPDFLKDTKQTAYIPFINGVVCVTAERMELKTYDQVEKHLWKDSIIDFKISLDNYDITGSIWYKFLACICGSDSPKTMTPEQTEKVFYLMSLIGYLSHKYKDPAKPYCVILAEQTETEEKGGGTGKGLLARGIGHLASICTIAGKTFDPLSRFAWQRLRLHNTIAVVDDVPKKFPFDGLYNVITEGVTLERKNQQEIFIPYENSPKIIVISNYVISGAGNHAERRQRVFEFMPFFSPKYTPEQHFGHILFDDWGQDEWNRFYGLMLSCIMLYLKNGIPAVERSEVLKQREIVQKYSKEFSTWFFDEYLKNGCGEFQSTTKLHTEFLEFAGFEKAEYSQKKFTTAILSACCLFGHHRQGDRQEVDGKKVSGFWIEKKTDRIN
jgi:hypothetical protein